MIMIVELFAILLLSFLPIEVDMNSDLMDAAKKGDTARIKALIKQGVQVDAKDEDGNTPLMIATYHGHLQAVKTLLLEGANVNAKHKHGGTVLMTAAFKGGSEIIRELLTRRAEVNAKDLEGRTALMMAVVNREPDAINAIRTLLDAGADAKVKDIDGMTALMMAVYGPPPPPVPPAGYKGKSGGVNVNVQKRIVEILIEGRAEVNAIANDGSTALTIAESFHNTELVKLLKQAGAR